jgi:hypothetical protein
MEVVEEVVKHRTFPIVHGPIIGQMRNMLSFQLEKTEMSELERAEMEEKVTDRYVEAMVPRWESVGVNAAQVVAENMTQQSLSSHRMAGVTQGASGFDRIKEIANMKNKQDIVRVVTTPIRGVPRSRAVISEIANGMVKVTLDSLIHPVLRYRLETVRPSWYSLFIKLMGVPAQLIGRRWIRIYLDEYLLYKYRITMPILYNIVNDNLGGANIAILYPPAQLVDNMYIDLHVKDDDTDEYDRNYSLYSRLPDVTTQIVGGIPSVSNAVPVSVNLLKDLQVVGYGEGVFELRANVPDFVPPSAWSHMIRMMVPDVEILSPNGRRFRSSNPQYQDDKILKKIIQQIPITYEGVLDTYTKNDDTGMVTVTFKKEKIDEFPFLEHVVLDDRTFPTDAEASDFLLLYIAPWVTYWYIECVCPRAQDLYSIPEVDPSRTYTTAALNCMESLGYLAMRSMLYQEFKNNISVDPSNIKIITNNMVLYRDPVAFKRQSLHNDKSEFLTTTTFEDVLKYSTQAAFTGEVDHMKSISSHVLTGQQISVGRGGDRLNRENAYVKARRESRPRKEKREVTK